MAETLTWNAHDRLVVGDCDFKVMPEDYDGTQDLSLGGAEFLVAKTRPMIERYVDLIEELRPRRMFELGVFQGGSTALLAELAQPEKLVAIDALGLKSLAKSIAAKPRLAGAVRVVGNVDQGDRPQLREILQREFDGEPLDLVIDDCSHLYDPTRASFNEIFPRLRPGGVYVIEGWPWAHTQLGATPLEGMFPGQTPLTRLVFETVLAVPSVPGLIDEIRVTTPSIEVRRGEAQVDPETFDIATCANPRGQALLSPR